MHNIKTVTHENGNLVAVSRSGEVSVVDEFGRERERYKVPYGAVLTIHDNAAVEGGQIIATWDPHTHPVISEVSGKLRFIDLVEGMTMNRQTDELTGLSNIVVTDAKQRGASGRDLRPLVKLVSDDGEDVFLA